MATRTLADVVTTHTPTEKQKQQLKNDEIMADVLEDIRQEMEGSPGQDFDDYERTPEYDVYVL